MRVLNIINGTTVDGPGFRTSIYFAGCEHHCPGCHNPESWDMHGGQELTIDEIMAIVEENEMDVTYSGGDPLYQVDELIELSKRIRENGKTIWCYTGFTYEEVCMHPKYSQLLPYLEVLVDSPFVESLRDTNLIFRGSSNQRMIRTATSTPGNIVFWDADTKVF